MGFLTIERAAREFCAAGKPVGKIVSALEIITRDSPSVQYVGASPWCATPTPNSSTGKLDVAALSFY
jgi:hypothetical protein